jgi:hypothetical protein
LIQVEPARLLAAEVDGRLVVEIDRTPDQTQVAEVRPGAVVSAQLVGARVLESRRPPSPGGQRVQSLALELDPDAVDRDPQAVGELDQPGQAHPVANRVGAQAVGLEAQAVGQLEEPIETEVEGVAQQGGVGKRETAGRRGLRSPGNDG